MSAKDLYHDACVHALQKDGWTITHDPLMVTVGKTDLLVDLGAERIVAAERNGERIAVEIKSFVRASSVQDLKEAVGQFVLYESVLSESPKNLDRTLFLAIRNETYDLVFEEALGQTLLRHTHMRLIVFDPIKEEIVLWKS